MALLRCLIILITRGPCTVLVCDIPLYDICDYNVSRDRCKELGCCFYKGVCYEKAVPVYVQIFTALIMLIAIIFAITITYRIIHECRTKTGVFAETLPSVNISRKESEQLSTQELMSLKLSLPTGSSKKGTESQMEAALTLSEHEETEE
ncbi:testis-expressed protein 29 isoform X1 [Microtus ochrogaster]|uniref:Testis-expressed protein 29 isoform X1 n=1 Tax=Microtus ochrogaster TaxID=79684 RepID=A0ABM1AV59_MICOH|nr:testis-expressed protein 29 isoform X1 [Microtus ochrogaster]